MKDVFTPFFPGSLAELLDYLQLSEASKAGDLERAIRAGNGAAAVMETLTNRRLVARTYRTAESVASCVVTIDSTAVTGSGFTAGVKALDEVVGVGIQPGSRVASVTSNTALVLDREATATGTVALTFGSEPLVTNGTGTEAIYIPEYPAQELYGAVSVDSDGTETALDTTGYRIGTRTGRLILPNDVFPEGDLNIRLSVMAGYREPSATVRGDFTDWTALQKSGFRAAQCFFQDEATRAGRIVDRTLGGVSSQLPDFRLPQDIVDDILQHFRRLW